MDPEPDADGDDQPQREVERCADGASESHRVRCPAAGCARTGTHRSPWPFTISRARSADCPSSRASTSSSDAAGETLYVGKARVLRDRVRSYLGAARHEPAHRRAAARRGVARGHRHRLGRRGAGAREPADQAAQPALQHPAARRQDVSVPAADDDRARAAAARGAPRRARRQRLRRAVHAGRRRPADDDRWRTGCSASDRATRSSTASATGRASSTTSSAASRRASSRSARSSATAAPSSRRGC